VPHWVEGGALFHIRIALDRENEQRPLGDSPLAQAVLESAELYHQKQHWHVTLFVLMPDQFARAFNIRTQRIDERGDQ
jgi:hypothetical protein